MGISGMIFKTLKEKTEFKVSVVRRWRKAEKIVKLREKRRVVNAGEVRKTRMGMKKTIQKMKAKRTKRKVPWQVLVRCFLLWSFVLSCLCSAADPRFVVVKGDLGDSVGHCSLYCHVLDICTKIISLFLSRYCTRMWFWFKAADGGGHKVDILYQGLMQQRGAQCVVLY